MNDKLYSLFDKIAPSQGDDELLNAVLRKAENNMEKKKISKKLLVIPAAAALALTVGAVGVGAAYDWDFAQAFHSFFSRGHDDVQAVGSGFDFSEAGKEIGITLEAEHCDIIVNGLVADSTNLYVLYDVVFDEGFDCATGITADWSNWLFGTTVSVNGEVVGISENIPEYGGCKIAEINGNTYKVCAQWNNGAIALAENDVVEMSFLGMFRYGYALENLDKTENVDFSDVSFETTLDFDISTDSKTVNIDRPITLRGHSATLDSVTVTPFTLSWQATYHDSIEDMFSGKDMPAIELSYTDITGKTATIDGGFTTTASYVTNISNGKAEWNYPVNISDIVSITIDGTTIDLI